MPSHFFLIVSPSVSCHGSLLFIAVFWRRRSRVCSLALVQVGQGRCQPGSACPEHLSPFSFGQIVSTPKVGHIRTKQVQETFFGELMLESLPVLSHPSLQSCPSSPTVGDLSTIIFSPIPLLTTFTVGFIHFPAWLQCPSPLLQHSSRSCPEV